MNTSKIVYSISEDPYVFDMDKNILPALTSDNVKRINFMIHNDSNYRFLDENNSIDSIQSTINKYGFTKKVKNVLDIVKIIDKTNSTHQASEGRNGGGKGCEKTAKYICSISDFYERLEKGDPSLVNDIALHAVEGRYTFSFASKYCAYMARALYKGEKADQYAIYDKIMRDILPYYAWVYLGEVYIKRTRSTIQDRFAKKGKGKYGEYRDLIDRIILFAENNTNVKYRISRKDFDHLLWYYFKGGSDNPRIVSAMHCVGKQDSRLVQI